MFVADYIWEKFDHPKLHELRTEFSLNQVISSGKTEMEKQILLRHWVSGVLPSGRPKDYSRLSALDILRDAKTGNTFWCTEYAFTFLQCATALGWYARKLAIDWNHEREQRDRHHGIADIWSNQFEKWYAVDAQHDLHYEKDGMPLNTLEIRMEYLGNKAQNVKGVYGDGTVVSYGYDNQGFNTPSNYFWFFISQRNNFLEAPGLFDTKAYLWRDGYNKDKTWYRNEGNVSMEHPMYKAQFVFTQDQKLCFPDMTKVR